MRISEMREQAELRLSIARKEREITPDFNLWWGDVETVVNALRETQPKRKDVLDALSRLAPLVERGLDPSHALFPRDPNLFVNPDAELALLEAGLTTEARRYFPASHDMPRRRPRNPNENHR